MKKILNRLKENISCFAGLDEEEVKNMERSLQRKKEQIELYNHVASEFIIKYDIPIQDTVPILKDGKYVYGNSKYQEYMDAIEKLRYEIEIIEESHLMKLYNKKR